MLKQQEIINAHTCFLVLHYVNVVKVVYAIMFDLGMFFYCKFQEELVSSL